MYIAVIIKYKAILLFNKATFRISPLLVLFTAIVRCVGSPTINVAMFNWPRVKLASLSHLLQILSLCFKMIVIANSGLTGNCLLFQLKGKSPSLHDNLIRGNRASLF